MQHSLKVQPKGMCTITQHVCFRPSSAATFSGFRPAAVTSLRQFAALEIFAAASPGGFRSRGRFRSATVRASQRPNDDGPSTNGGGAVIGLVGGDKLGDQAQNGSGNIAGRLVPADDDVGGGSGTGRDSGGSSGGGGGGGNGGGKSDGGGEQPSIWAAIVSLFVFMWRGLFSSFGAMAVLGACAAFVLKLGRRVKEMESVQIERLRRLQREAFGSLAEQGDQLASLEKRASLAGSSGSSGGGGWTTGSELAAPGVAAKVFLVGAVESAPAVILSQGQGDAAVAALRGACATPDNLEGAGSQLLRAQMRSRGWDGRDELAAEVLLPAFASSGSRLQASLHKVIYSLKRAPRTTLKLILGSGRGDDVAPSLNPAAGRGLTHLIRFGSAAHQRCRGSGIGGGWGFAKRLHAAAAHLVSGGEQPTASSIAQLTWGATRELNLGISTVRQSLGEGHGSGWHGTGGPEEDTGGWSLQGRLGDTMLPFVRSSTSHTLAATGTLNVSDSALVSWWATQPLQRQLPSSNSSSAALKLPREWGLSIASHPLADAPTGLGWAFAVGQSWGPKLPPPPVPQQHQVAALAADASAAAEVGTAGIGGEAGGSNGGVDPLSAAASPSPADAASGGAFGARRGGGSTGSSPAGSVSGGSADSTRGGSEAATDLTAIAAADAAPPWIAEASLQLPAGDGLILTPGLVAIRSDGVTTFAAAVRGQWAF